MQFVHLDDLPKLLSNHVPCYTFKRRCGDTDDEGQSLRLADSKVIKKENKEEKTKKSTK